MSSTTAGLHKLLHVQDTGRPISSVKGIQLQPTQRDSSFQVGRLADALQHPALAAWEKVLIL